MNINYRGAKIPSPFEVCLNSTLLVRRIAFESVDSETGKHASSYHRGESGSVRRTQPDRGRRRQSRYRGMHGTDGGGGRSGIATVAMTTTLSPGCRKPQVSRARAAPPPRLVTSRVPGRGGYFGAHSARTQSADNASIVSHVSRPHVASAAAAAGFRSAVRCGVT